MASRPDGDVWNIVDNDKDSQHYGRSTVVKQVKYVLFHKVLFSGG